MAKKPYQQPQKYGLCIDWETSGATWGGDSSKDFQGLTFGAIIFETENFTAIEELYMEIKYDPKWGWSEEAERIHGKTREYLEEHGVSQEEAATALIELILKYFGPDSKVMFMGHNAEFDRRFTNQLLNTVEFEFSVERENPDFTQIQLHHVVLDTSPIGFVTLGLYKSDLLFEKIGYDARGAHNALDDARMTLGAAAAIRQMMKIALGEA